MSSSKQSVGIVAGVIAGAAIAFVAGQWMTEAEAQVPGLGGQGHGMAIPAIEISEGSIALVRGPNEQYFVIDRQGNAYPVRYRNEDPDAARGGDIAPRALAGPSADNHSGR